MNDNKSVLSNGEMKQVNSSNAARFLLVDYEVLPDVFSKVIEVKKLLSSGKAVSATEAVKAVGISRSAYYKYKDAVFPYESKVKKQILTIQALLRDTPGILSCMLSQFANFKANILTVYQNIPVNHTALVSISARTENLTLSLGDFLESLSEIDGVLRVDMIINDD